MEVGVEKASSLDAPVELLAIGKSMPDTLKIAHFPLLLAGLVTVGPLLVILVLGIKEKAMRLLLLVIGLGKANKADKLVVFKIALHADC